MKLSLVVVVSVVAISGLAFAGDVRTDANGKPVIVPSNPKKCYSQCVAIGAKNLGFSTAAAQRYCSTRPNINMSC
jgi:hypothetical protein